MILTLEAPVWCGWDTWEGISGLKASFHSPTLSADGGGGAHHGCGCEPGGQCAQKAWLAPAPGQA